jgi:hypothetical protein
MNTPLLFLAMVKLIHIGPGNFQSISSKNHYVFNLAWLRERPR